MRKKDLPWNKKVEEVSHSFERIKAQNLFSIDFYENLFTLRPQIKKMFKHVDFGKA
jgi:3'-phosphoadenosine 5'-phosphosulfate sulfotransferase